LVQSKWSQGHSDAEVREVGRIGPDFILDIDMCLLLHYKAMRTKKGLGGNILGMASPHAH